MLSHSDGVRHSLNGLYLKSGIVECCIRLLMTNVVYAVFPRGPLVALRRAGSPSSSRGRKPSGKKRYGDVFGFGIVR